MPKQVAPEPKSGFLRRCLRRGLHPAVHVLALVSLHVVALVVISATGLGSLGSH
ncbi:hypothetical protein [Micromonospora sp. NPDC049662]|uniref:hypothetical protein n=1 Tax=Micromonospora sp. NPDC049662 TaxID=3155397 RepID=UPI0034230BAC